MATSTPDPDSAAPLPQAMRAWQITTRGIPSKALTLNTATPMPLAEDTQPSSSTLLIKISYAALNPADAHFMSVLPTFLPWRRRPIPCFDFVGTVVKAGPSAPAHLKPGAAVCAAFAGADAFMGKGALAEYVTVPADRVALVPDVMRGERLKEATGLGIAGQTAVLMLRTAKIERGNGKGMRAMVIGASGGVGSLLVQVLSAWGVHVVGVSSGANAEFITKLGVAEVVDYKQHDLIHPHLISAYASQPFDAIFDTAGSDEIWDHCASYLKKEGIFVSIVGGAYQGVVPVVRNQLWPTILGGVPRKFRLIGTFPNGKMQQEAVDLVNEGAIKEVPIDSEWPMEDAVAAFEKLVTHRAKGKIVIKVAA